MSISRPASSLYSLRWGHRSLPQIVIGVFNSHTIWGYDVTVVQWVESNSLTLIHDKNLLKSFNRARWKKGYNPDFIFASSSIQNMCVKSFLNPIPHTQHCVTVNPVLVLFAFRDLWKEWCDKFSDRFTELTVAPQFH